MRPEISKENRKTGSGDSKNYYRRGRRVEKSSEENEAKPERNHDDTLWMEGYIRVP